MAVADAYTTGQKVMGQANQKLGKLLMGLPEDLRFCGFFGVLAEVSLLGGSNPKNIRKYVWPFIWSIFALN